MSWCLIVVDGADLKKLFPLPTSGKVIIGKDPSLGQIIFNDFYLEKTHCTLEISDSSISVIDTSHDRGVCINGKKVVRSGSLGHGDILRVGNTYLRLDPYDGPAPEETQDPSAIPDLPLRRMIDLQGHTLGHYELGLVLGKGYHSVTFRARDLNTGKQVALKILSSEFPENIEELKKFAQIIKSAAPFVNHPHLVRCFGAGRIGPYVWVAQEVVEGDNLKSIFSQPETARSTWRGAWRLAWEIGHALDSLHRRQAFHGNITSSHLIYEHNGTVKLNDFRFREAIDGSVLQQNTEEQKLLGELAFIPPEKLESGAFIDEQIGDIYSLGIAAYIRLSSGKPPFQGNGPEETIDLIKGGVTDKLRRKAPPGPDDFVDIIFKMIARNQEDRYQSTTSLLEDLKRFKEAS